MNTRSSILTAALLCFGFLASAPVASADYPADCIDTTTPSVDQPCVVNGLTGPHTIQIPGGNPTGGSDGCGLDAGTPTPVGPVPVPTPVVGDPCLTDFASVTITGTGADTVVHVHFFAPPALPSAPFSDGDKTIEDLYLSAAGDFDNDGYATLAEITPCQSNPFNPLSTCRDADGDGLEFYQEDMTASQCSAAGGTYAAGTCTVDEETDCPGHDAGKSCDRNDWDTDDDLISDKNDAFPTDKSNGDPDGDGLLAAQESACGTDPAKKDTDGDGLHDGIECGPQTQDTDPLDADTDDDGFSDGAEVSATPPTDPTDPDSFPLPPPDGPDGCLDSDDGPFGEGICPIGSILYEDQRECDPTDSQGVLLGDGPSDPADCVPAGTDPCDVEDFPVVCGDPPSTDPCDYEESLPVVCGGDVPTVGSPLDMADPWDTNGNGKTNEANGQTDLVEQRLFYYDFDEAATSSRELNKDLEGSGGTIPGVTLVLWKPATTGTPPEAFRLHVGDGGQAGAAYPSEAFVLEEGPRGSPTAVTCVYTDAGHPYVARNGGQFDGSKADKPCGEPVSAIGPLNGIGVILGDVVFTAMAGPADALPLFELTDGDGDGVPEFVTLNLPDPASCTPEAEGCTSYAPPRVLPPEGVDPNELCGTAPGSFPTCLVPTNACTDDPESCVPDPCNPAEDPECAPPEDPAGDAIPPCSEVDTTQPAYVCFTDDEAGGAVTKHLEMNKIKVVVTGRPPIFL